MNISAHQLLAAASLATALLMAAPAHAFDPATRDSVSKLASGTWVKVSVKQSGIYAITASDARAWGFSDLSRVHVFGYGGAPVSETMSSDIPDDLPQQPVVRDGDRLLFYAQGPTTWAPGMSELSFVQVQHPYATAGCYFVTDDPRFGDVEIDRSTVTPGSGEVTDTYVDRLFHEQELVNPSETGRNLLGEDFRYTRSQDFQFSLPDVVAGSTVVVNTNFASQTVNGQGYVTVLANGTALGSAQTISTVQSDDVNHTHYRVSNANKSFTSDGTPSLTWTVRYNNTGNCNLARLDYVTVNYVRPLALNGGRLQWGVKRGGSGDTYRLAGAGEGTRVWDVTAPATPVAMNTTAASEGGLLFSPIASGHREYVAFNTGVTYPSPTLEGAVANQNLHASPTPDMIIISPTEYLAQAQRVAQLHTTIDSMRVLVVDQQQVFNEWSSGTPDAMAYRMMCKTFWDRGADAGGHRLGYLLLMGGGTYDNRQLSSTVRAASYPMLLTWQTETSNSENTSYVSDDPFAILSDGSNRNWQNYKLDIAVGRFPVKSVSQARTMVDKLEKYVTTADNGTWKNNMLYLADDENQGIHMQQADAAIATARRNGGSDFFFNKVYIDAFESISAGGGRTYPAARTKMFRLLNEGVVWWDYTGHASPNLWTADGMLTHTDINENLFYSHLPIVYAATCEFNRFDALETCGGANMLINSQGGAIAVVSPPRLVLITSNGVLHQSVARYQCAKGSDGLPLRLGDIVRLGKNGTAADNNNTRYALLGDPALRPAYPTLRFKVQTINARPANPDSLAEFQARQTITFAGEVQDHNGQRVTGFNGPVFATVYDSEQSVVTHGNGEDSDFQPYVFLDRPNKLAVATDTASAGQFSVRVTIPSEIDFDNYSPALVNLYGYDNSQLSHEAWNQGSREAQGANTDFVLYGYDDSEMTDTIGPEIEYLVLNNTGFTDGQAVNNSPMVLARVSDASGINLSTSGIGHAMTLTLDDNNTLTDVSSYCTPVVTSQGAAGILSYQLNDLADGPHTLKLKVWDVFNNSSSKTINFNVMSSLKPEIYDVYTDANPASVSANFYVTTSSNATLRVGIEIFDLMGRRVWSNTVTGRSAGAAAIPVSWDLTDYGGNRVQRGIYIYRASVSADGGETVTTKSKKIAVTAQ